MNAFKSPCRFWRAYAGGITSICLVFFMALSGNGFADTLLGSYSGTVIHEGYSTNFTITFFEGGICTFQKGESVYVYDVGQLYFMPAFSGTGTYTYDSATGQLTIDLIWTGNIAATNDANAHATRVRLRTLSPPLSVSSDRTTISGTAYTSGDFYYEGFGSWTDPDEAVTVQLTNPNPPQLTFRITGWSGSDGVALTFTTDGGGVLATVTSEANGFYSYDQAPYGWSGTITPSKEGYTFFPASRQLSNLTTNLDDQNFTAEVIRLRITGWAAAAGATMTFTTEGGGVLATVISEANTFYSYDQVPYGWSGTITPSKAGYLFTPTSRQLTELTTGLDDQNFSAALTVGFDATVLRVSEEDHPSSATTSTASVTVRLGAASAQSVTLQYAITGGTATGSGVDYTLEGNMLTFAPGETVKDILLIVVDDDFYEPPETIALALSEPTNAVLSSSFWTIISIVSHDPMPRTGVARRLWQLYY